MSLAVLRKKIPELDKIEVSNVEHLQFMGDYKATENIYYGPGTASIVKYEDDNHLYLKPTGSDQKGMKLYYLGNRTFGYERFPMDRIIFETDSSGQIAVFNTYWNGLRKGGFFRKQK